MDGQDMQVQGAGVSGMLAAGAQAAGRRECLLAAPTPIDALAPLLCDIPDPQECGDRTGRGLEPDAQNLHGGLTQSAVSPPLLPS